MEGFLSFCADDVTWTIVGERTVKGKDAIREWMSTWDAEPPRFTVHKVSAESNFVTAYDDNIYRFQGGKIVELNSFVIKTEARAESASGG